VLLDVFNTLSQHNVNYLSIQQQIDYSTLEARLFMMMVGATLPTRPGVSTTTGS
jgi:DNA invertase Pin-like site-specific DNA recombinase